MPQSIRPSGAFKPWVAKFAVGGLALGLTLAVVPAHAAPVGQVYTASGQMGTLVPVMKVGKYSVTGKVLSEWKSNKAKLGNPSGKQVKWNGGYYQRFRGGVITSHSKYGTRTVDTGAFNTMKKDFKKYGWPTKDTWKDAKGTHTKFQKRTLTTDKPKPPVAKPPVTLPTDPKPPAAPKPPVVKPPVKDRDDMTPPEWAAYTNGAYAGYTDKVATSKTVIHYGDSQLEGNSWAEQGALAWGFTDQVEAGYTGMGYSTVDPKLGVTAREALDKGLVPLPKGAPGLILVTLGMEDALSEDYKSDQQITQDAIATWTKLQAMYPKAKIVVNGVLTREVPDHARLAYIDDLLTGTALNTGFSSVGLDRLGTLANAEYKDGTNLTQKGHDAVTKVYRYTLKIAITN